MEGPIRIGLAIVAIVMIIGGALMGLSVADNLDHVMSGFWGEFDHAMMDSAGILIGMSTGFICFKHIKQFIS